MTGRWTNTDPAHYEPPGRTYALCGMRSPQATLRLATTPGEFSTAPRVCAECLTSLVSHTEIQLRARFNETTLHTQPGDLRVALPPGDNTVEWSTAKHYVVRLTAHGNEGGTPVREWAVPQGRRVTIIAGVFTELEMEGVPDGGF